MNSARWLTARAAARDYIRHTLYADLPLGTIYPALCLPRLAPIGVTEGDIYASRPGSDDPTFDEAGNPVPRQSIGRGPKTDDPTGAQAGSADAGWRDYLHREIGQAPDTAIELDRDTVLLHVGKVGSRYWRALYDLGHREMPKRLALKRGCSVGAVKVESRQALDALLERLYRVSALKRAS